MTTITRRALLAVLGAGTILPALTAEATATPPDQGSALRFEVYRDARASYRWRLKAGNGRVIATSGEGYKTKAACRDGIDLVIRGAATATVQDAA